MRRGRYKSIALLLAILGIAAWRASRPTVVHDAKWFLDQATESAKEVPDAEARSELYLILATKWLDCGDQAAGFHATELLWLAGQHSDACVEIFIRINDLSAARIIAMSSSSPRALANLVEADLQSGDVERAKSIATFIAPAAFEQKELADAQIADALMKSHQPRAAIELVKTIPKQWPGLFHMNVQRKDFEEARAFAESLPDATQRSNALCWIFKGEIELDMLDLAWETAAHLPGSDDRAMALFSISKEQMQLGRQADAMATLDELKIESGGLSDSSKRDMLNYIVKTQIDAGEFPAARKTLELVTSDPMSRQYPNCRDLPELIARAGDIEGAKKFAMNIEAGWIDFAIGKIAQVQAENRDYVGARMTADSIRKPDLRPYLEMANEMVKGGDLKGAIKLISLAENAEGEVAPTEFSYSQACQIAEGYFAAGDAQAARRLFQRAAELQIHSQMPRFLEIARSQIKCQMFDLAISQAMRDPDYNQRESILCEVFYDQLDAGDLSAALKTAAMVTDSTHVCENDRALASAYAQRGQQKLSHQYYHAALAIVPSIVPNMFPYEQAMAYEAIASAQVQNGQQDDVSDWMERLTDPIAKTHACFGAAEGFLILKAQQSTATRP